MTETMTKAMYCRELKAGEVCKKCGRPLIIVALKGKVFTACLRCTHKILVSRTSNKELEHEKSVKRE